MKRIWTKRMVGMAATVIAGLGLMGCGMGGGTPSGLIDAEQALIDAGRLTIVETNGFSIDASGLHFEDSASSNSVSAQRLYDDDVLPENDGDVVGTDIPEAMPTDEDQALDPTPSAEGVERGCCCHCDCRCDRDVHDEPVDCAEVSHQTGSDAVSSEDAIPLTIQFGEQGYEFGRDRDAGETVTGTEWSVTSEGVLEITLERYEFTFAYTLDGSEIALTYIEGSETVFSGADML